MADTMREKFEAWAKREWPNSACWPDGAWIGFMGGHFLGMEQARAELAKTSEAVAAPMSANRAAFFMERFKREEKLLGPNEQAAVAFVIAMLEREAATPQPAAERLALSDEQIEPMFMKRKQARTVGTKDDWYWYSWGVEDGERHHGIGQQAKEQDRG